jgi:crotonobetainyl-CoA:carnitine CoA-transferase CaiB-like acyl-CoA transferase
VTASPELKVIADDALFADEKGRLNADRELTEALTKVFRSAPASEWEATLRAADVACVAVAPGPVDANLLDDGSPGRECGFVTETTHPLFGDMPRLAPLVEFSRSSTVAGPAGLVGDRTDDVLRDLGYDDERIANLREAGVIGG